MLFCFGGKRWFSNFRHVVILFPSWVLEQFDFLWFLTHTWSVGTPPPHLEAMEGSASEWGRESRRGRGEGPVGRQSCHTSPQTSYYRGSLGRVKWGWERGLAQVDAYLGVSGNSLEWKPLSSVSEIWKLICFTHKSNSRSPLTFPCAPLSYFCIG